jgi:hypothetical protein
MQTVLFYALHLDDVHLSGCVRRRLDQLVHMVALRVPAFISLQKADKTLDRVLDLV